MKFLRYQQHNQVKPALMYHDCLYDLSDIIDDINSKNISQLSTIAKFNSDKIKQLPLLTQKITRENIVNCIDEPRKIIAIGMNYLDHLERVDYLGGEKVPPKEFIFFHKPSSSITGPYCRIESPRGMQKLDYENELGLLLVSQQNVLISLKPISILQVFVLLMMLQSAQCSLKNQGSTRWEKDVIPFVL